MAKILYGTHFVSEDEPCLGLSEVYLQSPGSRGFHRYQVILVMRGDRPATFKRDLGPMRKDINMFRIPGGAWDELTQRYFVVHTVGELIEIAEWLRGNPAFDKRELCSIN